MAISTIILGLRNNHDCNPSRNRGGGVCGGASLTWLAKAKIGVYRYHPHMPESALSESKRIMKEICEANGSQEQRILHGGKCAGLGHGKILATAISTVKAFKLLETLNGKFVFVMGSHIMAVFIGSGKVWLLDNESGLYRGDSTSDLIGQIKNLRKEEIGPLTFGKLTTKTKLWYNYTKVSIMQFP